MEDLLRSLAFWKLPSAPADVLRTIPLSSVAPKDKFDLGALAAHRGQTFNEVIEGSVHSHLEKSNYNNTNEISGLLSSIGLDPSQVNAEFPHLTTLMDRRHLIVHRADRDDQGGQGHHSVRSIGRTQVDQWIASVKGFGEAVLGLIPA